MCNTLFQHYACVHHIIVETKNVAVYICKGNFTGNPERHELTIMKGEHVSILDKTDAGMPDSAVILSPTPIHACVDIHI